MCMELSRTYILTFLAEIKSFQFQKSIQIRRGENLSRSLFSTVSRDLAVFFSIICTTKLWAELIGTKAENYCYHSFDYWMVAEFLLGSISTVCVSVLVLIAKLECPQGQISTPLKTIGLVSLLLNKEQLGYFAKPWR